jgi:hypothetical protein
MQVIRFDTFEIPKVKKTKEGYIRGKVVASRTGVFPYLNADNSIRSELRHPDDIFSEKSLDSLKMIPVTDDHPSEFVDASNAHKLQVGYTGETCNRDGDNIVTTITVTHKDAIDKILAGDKVELSLGYTVDLERCDGVYEGEKHDYKQTNLVYNHLAIVTAGRAGRSARFRFDNAAQLNNLNNFMEKELQSVEQADSALDSNKRNDAVVAEKTARIDALTAEKDLLAKDLKTSEVKLDNVTKALAKVREDFNELKKQNVDELKSEKVMDRVALLTTADQFLEDELDTYARHSDREIRVAVLSTREDTASIDFADKSDEYVSGMFDSFVSKHATNRDTRDAKQVLKTLNKHYDNSNDTRSRNEMLIKSMQEFSKNKQGK